MKLYKLSVFLVTLLLISTAFMPVVSAAATNQEMKKIVERLQVSQTSDDGKISEYIVTDKSATRRQEHIM